MKQTDPIFIAEFANGHQSCTAVFCSPDNLNPSRGLMLACRASRSLYRMSDTQWVPPIVRARFEFNGAVLATYDAATIAALFADPQFQSKANQRIP